MSQSMSNAFVQQYAGNVYVTAQQKGSKLRDCVTVNPDGPVAGLYAFHDRVGATNYNTVINRNGDTPLNQTPFDRRRCALVGRDWSDLIDKLDKVQTLLDPTSATVMVAGMTMGRAIDDIIIANVFAAAQTNSGIDGTTPTAVNFPAGNIIAVNDRTYQDQGNAASGNSSLTVAKLIYAKELFGAGNVDLDNDDIWIPANAQSIASLLTATPVTSIWYNRVQPLVEGKLDQFMGINFKRTELAIKTGLGVSLANGSGYNLIPVWCKSGMVLDIGEDIVAEVAKDPSKRYSWRPYFQMFMGALRMEEAKVVQLICDPTKTF